MAYRRTKFAMAFTATNRTVQNTTHSSVSMALPPGPGSVA